MTIDLRRPVLRFFIVVLAAAATFAILLAPASGRAAGRPNFVWLVSEDNSVHYMKLFDPAGAPAPNIEKLARSGLIFEHAFACGPVCSVARTTLATSIYAPRVGTQFHRRSKLANLPAGWRMFPYFLRRAGYYTTNNAKKDYNAVEGEGVWDESSRRATWRRRPAKEAPFFHMQSFGASHESSLHFSAEAMRRNPTKTDPASVRIPPYFPDTPLFRYTRARYHDRIGVVDEWVGGLVRQLEEDGLLEDTFIFYFGDHGGVLPGSKGYLYETGLHVPLVVRVPKKWAHLVPFARGTRVKGFVSFVDFGPTLLHLAGIPVPKHMDGRPFLGKGLTAAEIDARDEAFGYADRFDEKYDLCRSLRKGRYKYIRNYEPFYPDALQNNYRYRMLAYQEWRRLFREGKLNAVQRRFFEAKAPEALYDLETDPDETRNLARDPAHRPTLLAMRARLTAWVKWLPDLSFFPESFLYEHAFDAPHEFAERERAHIARLVDVADLSLVPFAEARAAIEAALGSDDPWVRYWGLIACSSFGEAARPFVERAGALLADREPLVRVRAAEFLGVLGAADPRPAIMEVLRTSDSPLVSLLTLNTVVFFRDGPRAYRFAISERDVRAVSGEVRRRLDYLAGVESRAKKKRKKRHP